MTVGLQHRSLQQFRITTAEETPAMGQTDHDRAVLIAAEIPGADPTMLSLNMVKGVLATTESASLRIACLRWLGRW